MITRRFYKDTIQFFVTLSSYSELIQTYFFKISSGLVAERMGLTVKEKGKGIKLSFHLLLLKI